MQRALPIGLIVLASVATAQRARAQVTEFDFFKAAAYFQLVDNAQPTSAVAYAADAGIFTVMPGDYSGANIDNEFNFTFIDGEWFFQTLYASLANLNARFPAGGSFTVNMLAGTESAVSQTVTLGGPPSHPLPSPGARSTPHLRPSSPVRLRRMYPSSPHSVPQLFRTSQ